VRMPFGRRHPITTPVPPGDPPAVDLESFRIVCALAAQEYANENDRTKVLDAKAGPLIGATGAVIAFTIGTLVKPPDTITGTPGPATVVYFTAIVAALVCLILAQLSFLRSVAVRAQFRRVELASWVDLAVMRQPGWQTLSELASTYEAAVRENTRHNDRKARFQTVGVWLLLVGTIFLAVIPATVLTTIVLKLIL
jgi:hypothetical protein